MPRTKQDAYSRLRGSIIFVDKIMPNTSTWFGSHKVPAIDCEDGDGRRRFITFEAIFGLQNGTSREMQIKRMRRLALTLLEQAASLDICINTSHDVYGNTGCKECVRAARITI